jgi:excisionase family DNA binding protein
MENNKNIEVLKFLQDLKKDVENLSKPQEKDLMSSKETALFLDLSLPTIYSKVCRKELPYMKRGKRIYFSRKQLLEFYNEGSFVPQRNQSIQVDEVLTNIKGRKNV